MIDNISNTFLFICSRIPFGLIVFSDEYGLLEVESVSKEGMIECVGTKEESLFLPYYNIKPVLYPNDFSMSMDVEVRENEIRSTCYFRPYHTDILGLIYRGEAMSVYDLPFDPYESRSFTSR